MREYHYITARGKHRVKNAFFVPGFASYLTYPSRFEHFSNLDALLLPRLQRSPDPTQLHYVSVSLNKPARVFVLLSAPGMYSAHLDERVTVTGAPSTWGSPVPVVLPTGFDPTRRPSFSRANKTHSLPFLAVCIEVNVNRSNLTISLPHPATMAVNGRDFSTYAIVFGQDIEPRTRITAFERPSVPNSFRALVGDAVDNYSTTPLINPRADVPMPNSHCPQWLHDTYVTASSDRAPDLPSAAFEPAHWRTWHPIIDPVYWCYFDHEHGSYPGNYRPMFGYMEWKMGQLESHNGFKVFSLPVSPSRAVVITVHMHLSQARRFTARRHTTIFAVCESHSPSSWTLQMELYMKMDFGSAQVTFRNRSTVPLDWDIFNRMRDDEHTEAGRRFNVLDLSNFPSSVDDRFMYNSVGRGDNQVEEPNVGASSPGARLDRRTLARGIYEVWKGPLNTCSWSRSRPVNRGFAIDVRDPATAMRSTADIGSVQTLAGKSIDRVMEIGPEGMVVSLRRCRFDIFHSERAVDLEKQGGVFYTDPYMSVVKGVRGRHNVRQFIRHGFQDVEIAAGRYSPVRVWNSPLLKEAPGSGTRRALDLEHAIDASVN